MFHTYWNPRATKFLVANRGIGSLFCPRMKKARIRNFYCMLLGYVFDSKLKFFLLCQYVKLTIFTEVYLIKRKTVNTFFQLRYNNRKESFRIVVAS